MQTPDKGIPHDLLEKAHCVGMRAESLGNARLLSSGAKYGKGIITCRDRRRMERPFPRSFLEGGNIGLQMRCRMRPMSCSLYMPNASGENRLYEGQVHHRW